MSSLSRGTVFGPHGLLVAASHPIPMAWTNSCLSFQDSTWPETVLGSTASSSDSSTVLHSSTRQSDIQVLMVDLLPWSLLMNPCPRIFLVPYPRALTTCPCSVSGLKHQTAPKLPPAFLNIWASPPKSHLLRLVYPLGHPISSWTLLCCCWFFGTVIRDWCTLCWPDSIFTVSMGTSNLSAIPSPRKSQIQVPSLPAFPLLLLITGHAPVWPREIIFSVFGHLCRMVGESGCCSVHVTQLGCINMIYQVPPVGKIPYWVREGEENLLKVYFVPDIHYMMLYKII